MEGPHLQHHQFMAGWSARSLVLLSGATGFVVFRSITEEATTEAKI